MPASPWQPFRIWDQTLDWELRESSPSVRSGWLGEQGTDESLFTPLTDNHIQGRRVTCCFIPGAELLRRQSDCRCAAGLLQVTNDLQADLLFSHDLRHALSAALCNDHRRWYTDVR